VDLWEASRGKSCRTGVSFQRERHVSYVEQEKRARTGGGWLHIVAALFGSGTSQGTAGVARKAEKLQRGKERMGTLLLGKIKERERRGTSHLGDFNRRDRSQRGERRIEKKRGRESSRGT